MKKAQFPHATRWTMFIAGTLSAGLIGCGASPTSNPGDAGTDTTVNDIVDVPTTPDVTDVTQPTDIVVADVAPDNPAPVDVAPDVPPVPVLSTRPIAECGSACRRPIDAIPDSMGNVVFFTAFTPTGAAGVFRVPVQADDAGIAVPLLLASGNGLEFPVGITISNDNATLYIADQSASRGDNDGIGAIYSLPATGGSMPTLIMTPPEFINPAAISITADGLNLLVTGQQVTDMGVVRAVYRISLTGGMPTVISTNLVDPSGVSQTASGTVLVHDTRRGGSRSATAVAINGTTATDLAGSLFAGYPAGLAYARDGHGVLLSGADGSGGLLTWVGADGMATSPAALSTGMSAPLGLHRASMRDVWAVADDTADVNGRIFLVTSR